MLLRVIIRQMKRRPRFQKQWRLEATTVIDPVYNYVRYPKASEQI